MHYAHYDNELKSMLEKLILLHRWFEFAMPCCHNERTVNGWSECSLVHKLHQLHAHKDRNSPFWMDTEVYPTDEVRRGKFWGSGCEYAKSVSWNVTPCSLIKAQTFRRHLLSNLVNENPKWQWATRGKKKVSTLRRNVLPPPQPEAVSHIFLLNGDNALPDQTVSSQKTIRFVR